MEQLFPKKEQAKAEVVEKSEQPRRKRSMTTLKLQWVAERVRKCRKIQMQIEDGTYHVDSREVAKSILRIEDEQKKMVGNS